MSLPRLYLERVDDAFDPARDAVLGPWCFIGREDADPAFMEKTYIDPLPSLGAVPEAADRTTRLMAFLIKRYARELNARFDEDLSHVGWMTVLAPWLTSLVHALYLRYVQLQRFVEQHGTTPYVVRVWDADMDWGFVDAEDSSTRGPYNPYFNWWVRSRMLRRCAPEAWTLESAAPNPADLPAAPGQPYLEAVSSVKSRVMHKVKRWVGLTGTMNERSKIAFLALMVNLLPGRRPAFRPDPVRALINNDYDPLKDFPAAFLELLEDMLPRMIPRVFGEDFERVRTLTQGERYVPGKVRMGTLDNWNPVERYRVAKGVSRGEVVVQLQYGGIFGLLESYPFHADTCFRPMWFFSWGWRDHPDMKSEAVLAAPAVELMPLIDKHRFEEDTVIFVATYFFLVHHRLLSAPQPSGMVKARDGVVAFLNGLDTKRVGRLMYRPYWGGNTDLEGARYILSRVEGAEELTGNLHDALYRCRLLVLNHPGTTLNMALVANVPTVCLWSEEEWRLSPEARPVFDQMRAAGMFFDDIAEAQAFINGLGGDVRSWWQRADVQAARRAFCRRFANTRPWLWWVDWLRALNSVRRLGNAGA